MKVILTLLIPPWIFAWMTALSALINWTTNDANRDQWWSLPLGMTLWVPGELARSVIESKKGRTVDMKYLKVQMDKLRSEASRGAVPSAVVFALTDPIMDKIHAWEYPRYHACCGYFSDGPHNSSCDLYF